MHISIYIYTQKIYIHYISVGYYDILVPPSVFFRFILLITIFGIIIIIQRAGLINEHIHTF